VTVDKKGIKDSCKEYMEKLTNEENEGDHRLSVGVKKRPADCIRINDVAAMVNCSCLHLCMTSLCMC